MATSVEQPAKQTDKRKPNWTPDENLLLVQLIEENKNTLRGKFSQRISTQTKRSTWQTIATQLSIAFPHVIRTPDECEKKWYNLLSKSRQQIAAYRRQITGTGGGPSPAALSAVAQTVQDILGESNTSISGLDDGVDSSYLQVLDMTSSLDSESLFATVEPLPSTSTSTSTSTCVQEVQLQPVVNLPLVSSYRSHEARKRQLELEVLEAQLLYFTLKIKKIKNDV